MVAPGIDFLGGVTEKLALHPFDLLGIRARSVEDPLGQEKSRNAPRFVPHGEQHILYDRYAAEVWKVAIPKQRS